MKIKIVSPMTMTFIIFSLLAFFALGYMHESVHVEVFKSYNISSSIHMFKYFPDFITTPERACVNPNCTLAHDINEAIGYQLIPIFALFIIFGVFSLLLVEDILGAIEKNTQLLENIHVKGGIENGR